MKVYRVRDKIIKKEKIRSNPDVLYLFGDNIIRKGLGGQAKEMRGEPNVIGIITKKYPHNKEGAFFYDRDYKLFKSLLIEDSEIINGALKSGKYHTLVIPPIGEGLANLPKRAPRCWRLLKTYLDSLEEKVNNYRK